MTSNERERLRAIYEKYERESDFARRWDPRNPGNAQMTEERDAAAVRMLRDHGAWPDDGSRVLDLGCGDGRLLERLERDGLASSALFGLDLLRERADRARARITGVVVGDGAELPFRSGSFSVALAFTVFSSILHEDYSGFVASEIDRVLEANGAVLVYDVRVSDPRNPQTTPIRSQKLRQLFPGYEIRSTSLTLVPALSRRLGSAATVLYPRLVRFPFLRTHKMSLLTKPGTARVATTTD